MSDARPRLGGEYQQMRSAPAHCLAALLVGVSCAGPSTVAPPASGDATPSRATATATATASASRAPLTLHWMSLSLHSEPRYRLLYEGGRDAAFTQLRLIGPDGRVVTTADAVKSADEVLRLCGRSEPGIYGPLRATLILATAELLSDVIRRPDAYRVEALAGGSWLHTALVNECHGQE